MAATSSPRRRSRKTEPPPPTPNARATLTASARRLEVGNPDDLTWLKKQRQEWQDRAWQYNDTVGEVNFAHRYLHNMLSRLRLFPAWRADPNADPIPMDPDNLPEDAPDDYAFVAENARLTLERLAGPGGSYGNILGPLAWNVGLIGEAYLIGLPDEDSPTGETFEVLSIDELHVKDADRGIVAIRDHPGDLNGQELEPGVFFVRIWRRHPRWRNRADAPMSALLDVCEELQLLTASVMASARSRLNAGILVMSDAVTFTPQALDPLPQDGDGQVRQDPFMADLERAMIEPLHDPGHPSTLVPLLLRMPDESVDKLKHIILARPVDERQLEERNELRTRLATGLDLPAEIILGMEDSNHWTAWQIDEQTYKAHLDPLAVLICESLTKGFLLPALRAMELNTANVLVGHDPSDLIGDENEFDQAAVMHEQRVVSHAYLRRKGGASEDDAPDPEELAAWPTAQPSLPGGPGTPQQPPGLPGETPSVPPQDGQEAARLTVPPGWAATGTGRAVAAPAVQPDPLLAAVVPLRRTGSLQRLAERLTDIDRTLRLRLIERADQAVRRTVERAGARAFRAIQTKDRRYAATLRKENIQPSMLLTHVGREQLHHFELDPELLLEDDLDELESFYRKQTTAAYRQTITSIGRELKLDVDANTIDTFEQDRDRNIDAGWILLAAGIRTHAQERVFTPIPTAPLKGEFDALTVVRPQTIRESLAVAGGATKVAPDRLTGTPSGGIATGDETLTFIETTFGITANGGRWLYGDPSSRTRPFEPHEALDQADFTDWDDPILTNDNGWPDTDHYYPGDHDGCLCDYIPALEAGE